ncbi:MAG: CehA/McbA family metallohydrolase [Limisphaerales bacterium]
MNTLTRIDRPLFGPCMVAALALAAGAPAGWPADAPQTLPSGIVDFAGRISHNHWYLFGPEQRPELEALNRDLREAQQQTRNAPGETARQAAGERLAVAAGRLLERVKSCPRLLRVDLAGGHPKLAAHGPVELPGDTGALLIEVLAGGEGVSYTTGLADMSQPAGESSLVPLDAAANGATYAVAGLEHVPFGRTTLTLEFRRPGQAPVRLLLDVATPAPGRLELTVLSDDTGKPAPAMVQLLSQTDGSERQPANGLTFAPQFDKQGNTSGARAANLPGALHEPFWCMPGPVGMALAPGTWQIGVRRGVEHEAVFQEATVRSGETTRAVLRPRRWVNMPRLGWWSGDDHVHCRIVSDEDARRLLAWVQAEDVHLANIVKMGDIYRTFFEQRGFGPGYRVAGGDYVLAPGQECPRTHDQLGHVLAMDIPGMVRDTDHYYLYDQVFDTVHAQGGLTGYAHVNSGNFHVHRDMSLNVPRAKADFVEILQFNNLGTDLYYDFLNLGCKLTASAGSDVPWGGTVGEVRAYAFLGRKPFSADAWFAAFRRGRTFTTSGPMLEFQVDQALPGDELRLKSDRRLRVHARAWGDPKRTASLRLEVVRHGAVIRSVESADPRPAEARIDFTVDAGAGCWLAARARAGDGTSAHTTPVYVVREGLRFWKFDGLDELLAKRLASLAEIEQIVAEARRLEAEGRLGTDRARIQLAWQGDALLERVALARQLYEDLKRLAQAERPRRAALAR